jgi:hypothetical protein
MYSNYVNLKHLDYSLTMAFVSLELQVKRSPQILSADDATTSGLRGLTGDCPANSLITKVDRNAGRHESGWEYSLFDI